MIEAGLTSSIIFSSIQTFRRSTEQREKVQNVITDTQHEENSE